MTLKQFFQMVTGVDSVGIYDRNDKPIDAQGKVTSLLKYLDTKILQVRLFTINGSFKETEIRACIRLDILDINLDEK